MGGEEGKSEEVFQALTEFSEMPPSQRTLSAELENALQHIANTGQLLYPWKLVRPVVLFKLEKVVREFFESCQHPNDEHPETEFLSMKSAMINRFERFQLSPPFTIQRICELLVTPRSGYTNCAKYMRGLLKNIKVVSTVNLGSCNGTVANWPKWDSSDCNGRTGESPEVALPPPVTTASPSSSDGDHSFNAETVRPSTPPASLPSPYSPPLSPTSEDTRVVDNRQTSDPAPGSTALKAEVVENGACTPVQSNGSTEDNGTVENNGSVESMNSGEVEVKSNNSHSLSPESTSNQSPEKTIQEAADSSTKDTG